MKISKETRRAARKLFHGCFVNSHLDENRVHTAVSLVGTQKTRHYLGILTVIEKLVRSESQKLDLLLESAVSLNDTEVREMYSHIQTHFSVPLISKHRTNPSLIGGLRIKVGSHVWDGSIAARLRQLEVRN